MRMIVYKAFGVTRPERRGVAFRVSARTPVVADECCRYGAWRDATPWVLRMFNALKRKKSYRVPHLGRGGRTQFFNDARDRPLPNLEAKYLQCGSPPTGSLPINYL
jgi:hypothetical protein